MPHAVPHEDSALQQRSHVPLYGLKRPGVEHVGGGDARDGRAPVRDGFGGQDVGVVQLRAVEVDEGGAGERRGGGGRGDLWADADHFAVEGDVFADFDAAGGREGLVRVLGEGGEGGPGELSKAYSVDRPAFTSAAEE